VDEPSLVRLFVELTGDSDAAGKSVLMYLEILERDYFPRLDDANGSVTAYQGVIRKSTP
jgi:hypothetical protein